MSALMLPPRDMSLPLQSVARMCFAAAALVTVVGCNGSIADENGGPCPAGPVFGTPILPLTELDHIVPLGSINPSTERGGHTLPTSHVYWNTREPGLRPVTLYAPGDLIIRSIYRSEISNPRHDDYEITFAVCEDVEGGFAHVSRLSGSLQAALSNPRRCETANYGSFTRTDCEFIVRRTVRQGDVIGSASEFVFQRGIDFALRDSRETLAFANPSRWPEWVTHTVCPVEYYEPSVRSQLETLLGVIGMRRTIPPLCGRIDFDVPGSAQGVWFRTGGTAENQGLVVLMTDNVLPTTLVFSIGAIGSLTDGRAIYFPGSATGAVRRAFDQVRADGEVWCYDELNRVRSLTPGNAIRDTVVLLQLRNDGRLQFESRPESGCGAGPWALSSAALTLER